MNRGIVAAQVFMYIVAAVTFAVIMIFGVKIVKEFMETGEQAEFIQFKNDLETSIKKIYTEYGSTRKHTFLAPPQFEQICFVDLSEEYDATLCGFDAVACATWEQASDLDKEANDDRTGYDFVDENVFLTPIADVKIKVHRMSVVNEQTDASGTSVNLDYLCLPLHNGQFTIMLEGKGDHTEIFLPGPS